MYGLDKQSYEGAMNQAQMPRQVTMREQLKQTLAHHEREVIRVQQLLELLDKNPAIEQFMDLSRS